MIKTKQVKKEKNKYGDLPSEIVEQIEVNLIEPSPFEPQRRRRTKFKDEDIDSLGESILKHRLRQPILVRPSVFADESVTYEIVFGERRWLASKRKAIAKISCFVENLTDAETIELQYEENHKRQDPDPLDDAFYFKYLQEIEKFSILDLSLKFSLSERSVINRLKLNDLIDGAKEQLSAGILPLGHATYMSKFPVKTQQEIFDENLAFRFNNRTQGAVSFNEFRQEVEAKCLRRLADAPFEPADPQLHIKGLVCMNCSQRSGFVPKLFDEFAELAENDTCMNRDCFETKSNIHLRLEREKIAAARAVLEDKPVEVVLPEIPLVTSKKYVHKEDIPFTQKTIVNQTLLNTPECGFSELSLVVDGPDKGKQRYICREKSCPVHYPAPVVSPEDQSAKLNKLEDDFNERVRQAAHREVFARALKFFDDYNPVWMFDDIVQSIIFKLLFICGPDQRSAAMEIVKSWKIFPKDFQNPFAVKDAVSRLSKEQQSQIIFLLTFISKGFYPGHPLDEIVGLANDYAGTNYRLIEAEKRLELAPDEFKPVAEKYLDDLRAGNDPPVPQFWIE